jgi:hypothetical protein
MYTPAIYLLLAATTMQHTVCFNVRVLNVCSALQYKYVACVCVCYVLMQHYGFHAKYIVHRCPEMYCVHSQFL